VFPIAEMETKIVYVERNQHEYVSLEKAFRQIAAALPTKYKAEFQKTPYGLRPFDTVRNLFLFRKRSADIYHITGHINYIALLFPPNNSVLSVMDLRILQVPGKLRRYILKKLYLDFPIRKMRYITAISEQTRREIIASTGCDERKVRVIDLPVFEHLSKPVAREFNKDRPRLLQVGTMENKNIANLARGLRGINCELRIIGIISDQQSAVLQENEIAYTSVFGLSDQEMRGEYLDADIVTFCSTYEGFGLPIIEGQAMGKPVITSDLSPMRETSGGSACLIDPNSPESIREGVLLLINDDRYRDGIIEGGWQNVERFSPAEVAKKYHELYDEILSNGDPVS
jgi:glycosyltransferase involved in cell wall biosynthesis